MENENKKSEEKEGFCDQQPDDRPENADEEKQASSEKGEESKKDPSGDAQTKKIICCLAYLFGLLFFLPLVMYPGDETAKFHANQSLVILLVTIIGELVLGILSGVLGGIPVLGVLFGILCGVFGLAVLIVCIYCIVCVVNDQKKELPVIGKIKLFK